MKIQTTIVTTDILMDLDENGQQLEILASGEWQIVSKPIEATEETVGAE